MRTDEMGADGTGGTGEFRKKFDSDTTKPVAQALILHGQWTPTSEGRMRLDTSAEFAKSHGGEQGMDAVMNAVAGEFAPRLLFGSGADGAKFITADPASLAEAKHNVFQEILATTVAEAVKPRLRSV